MKKTLFLIVIITLTLMLFCACELPDSSGNDGDGSDTPSVETFTVTASERVVYGYLDGQSITLGVDQSKSSDASQVSYEVTSGGSIATVDETGVMTFSGYGTVTVKAKIGNEYSANEITVYCSNLAVDRLDRFFSILPLTSTDFGGEFYFLPLHQTEYLTLEGNGCAELVQIDTDDENAYLRVVGVTDGTTIALVDIDGETVWSGTLASATGTISETVRRAALAQGLISEATADVPRDTVEQITSLSLPDYAPATADGYAFLDHIPALNELDLSGSKLFDLSFLQGRALTRLVIRNLSHDALTLMEQDAILSSLDSLTALKTVDLVGAFGAIDRALYNELCARVLRGDFAVVAMDGVTLDTSNVTDFSASVFFTTEELTAHIAENGNALVASQGYSHAIVSLAHDGTPAADDERYLNASNLTTLELYGDGSAYRSAVFTANDLTLNLYEYQIYMGYDNAANAVESTANLRINVMRGHGFIKGGDSVWVTDASGTWCLNNGSGIVCHDLTLYTAPGATLTVRGGNGNLGTNGIADGSDPNSATSAKQGGVGGTGACAINANAVTILSGTYYIYGGAGAKGGNGGDGSNKNIFSGGYNGGNGGRGGNGGYGIYCSSYSAQDGANLTIEGGRGGDGGDAGNGYLAGKSGAAGGSGDTGIPIAYK